MRKGDTVKIFANINEDKGFISSVRRSNFLRLPDPVLRRFSLRNHMLRFYMLRFC
jgi:hypothetical protein